MCEWLGGVGAGQAALLLSALPPARHTEHPLNLQAGRQAGTCTYCPALSATALAASLARCVRPPGAACGGGGAQAGQRRAGARVVVPSQRRLPASACRSSWPPRGRGSQDCKSKSKFKYHLAPPPRLGLHLAQALRLVRIIVALGAQPRAAALPVPLQVVLGVLGGERGMWNGEQGETAGRRAAWRRPWAAAGARQAAPACAPPLRARRSPRPARRGAVIAA